MKRQFISILALLLAVFMIAGGFASCSSGDGKTDTTGSTDSGKTETEKKEESNNEKDSDAISESESVNADTEDQTNDSFESDSTNETKDDETEKQTEQDTEQDTEPVVGPTLEGKYGPTIEYANRISDGVQAYYNIERTNYTVTNDNMSFSYPLTTNVDQVVSYIKNTKGKSYIENTMDVFVTMDSGKTYWTSNSTAAPRANIYKLGYYYYDVHLMEQNFMGGAEVVASKDFLPKIFTGKHDINDFKIDGDVVSYVATNGDPYVFTTNSRSNERFWFDAAEYNALQFEVKVTKSTNGDLYFIAGDKTGHTPDQHVSFKLVADGEWHTYTVILNNVKDYTGRVTSFRFDIGAAEEKVELKNVKAVKVMTDAPSIVVDRNFHTYSDKMNQVLHFVASSETTGIKALGMSTKIAADTVEKIVVKDKNGLKYTLEGVDWNSAEYIGFDIKNVGIFGYILLAHENSGKLEVTLADGVYTITQTSAPKNGTILPPDAKNTYTSNDFYMGQRIYTDEKHTFDAFLVEAEFERHPMETISGSKYVGYDALVGAYKFTITGDGFNEPFFNAWNRHHVSDVKVVGGNTDRNIYVYTRYEGGCGEGAVILDENNLSLPIPVMIYKNFGGENEEPVFNAGDNDYSETYFPLVIKAGETSSIKVLNLYQNWGAFPLKQLSSIQYFWPYYHLSIGTTETSCISPWYGARDLWTLPDFRSMSMPYWFELEPGKGYGNQPQHTHGGYQYFLQYTDADGNYSASENIHNDVISSGPVYAEVDMDYISDDGKMKISYTHLEYAQTDELRAYYEIEYEILEEIKIADFKKDFSFYSFEGYAGYYRKMGYLNENNEPTLKKANHSATPEMLILGDKNPYVALFDLVSTSESWKVNNVNLGFVIYNSEFVFSGEKCTENFVVNGANSKYSLSLNLGEVTLKPGDTMKLNMVIVPWGWSTSTDDQNMREVRLNTCLYPLTYTVEKGEKIESTYMPRIKSTDGKSAEFTLAGGSNNVAVRVYGFDKMTAPKIYEKINGKWEEYVICSINNPDKIGNKHYYDGYSVYYDGDGTYSYAFTVNMDNVESRTFKIEAADDFAGWPEVEKPVNTDPLNVYLDPEELASAALANTGIGSTQVSEDGDYIRIFGGTDNAEAFFTAYKKPSEGMVSGQYLVIKYRVPETNAKSTTFEIFTSTVSTGAKAGECFFMPTTIKDGQWHILIADLSKQSLPTFTPNANGEYVIEHLRIDVFNNQMDADNYIDIAYIGLSDNLIDICKLNGNSGAGYVCVRQQVIGMLNFATGEITDEASEDQVEGGDTPNPENYIDPESGWKKSDLKYKSAIDFINGKGDGNGAYDQRGGTHTNGIDVITFDGPTAGNAYLSIAGWTVVDKGIAKYMWSADDGKTWNECVLYNRDSYASIAAGSAILAVAKNVVGYDYFDYQANSIYQGSEGKPSGIAAQLTDYVGKTVNVIFAAVPATESDSLCLIAYIKNVRVYESDEKAEAGEKAREESCTHSKATAFKFLDDGNSATDKAVVSTTCKCGAKGFEIGDPKYVFYFQNVKGSIDSGNVFSSCENSKDYRLLDCSKYNLRTDADGCLTINGWGGVDGGCSKIVFRVYSSNGTELTDGWIDWTSGESKHAEVAVEGEMAKRGIDVAVATRFNNIRVDLSQYVVDGASVKLQIAMVADSAPDGSNDKYVYLCEMINIVAG